MKIISKQAIQSALVHADRLELMKAQESGFIAYSQGKACIPEVGHLYFENPSGDCHIKYGYIQGGETFTIKVATGFYENSQLGLPNGNGLILLFDQKTGVPQALLQDEGILTDLRTAIAGALSARYLAPKNVTCIGILGTGVQARLQLEWLSWLTGCKHAFVWGRSQEKQAAFLNDSPEGIHVQAVSTPKELAEHCNLIACCTASKQPLLFADDIRQGTHIIAVGADGNGKQELDPLIFNKADICSVDSLSQCLSFGESCHTTRDKASFVELGQVISSPELGRQSDVQITISDLTGVAVQDIQMAQSILTLLNR